MEKQTLDLCADITKDFKPRDKAQLHKHMGAVMLISPETISILRKYGISLKRCDQMIVLDHDPKTLTQALDLAQKMGFLEAYRAEPKRLTGLVQNVIKRMAKCDAMGINYKSEDGIYANWLFSQRDYNEHMASIGAQEMMEAEEVVAESQNLDEVKEYAVRVLEQFAMVEQQDAIFAKLDEIKDAGLGIKEMLMEAFKIFPGNTELLSDTIDELLEQNEKVSSEGRAQ